MAEVTWGTFPSMTAVTGKFLVGLDADGTTNIRMPVAGFLLKAQNLADVASVPLSRASLAVPAVSVYAGNPNTFVAGAVGDFVIDTTNSNTLFMCTTAGIAAAAVWTAQTLLIAGEGTASARAIFATSAVGNYSFSFGLNTTAAGLNSVSFGNGSTAAGNYAFSVGVNAQAAGLNSMAFGNAAHATGDYSFARGLSSVSNGAHSVAMGNGAITTNAGSVVWGGSTASPQTDTAANQFCLSFAGGYRFFLGDFSVLTLGKGLRVVEGANAKQGVVTLVAGVGVVANTAVTASSRIFYCGQDTAVTGFLRISARSAGSGFTITSSQAGDTGVVAYEIFEPAV